MKKYKKKKNRIKKKQRKVEKERKLFQVHIGNKLGSKTKNKEIMSKTKNSTRNPKTIKN
jgi:hypothetical protein